MTTGNVTMWRSLWSNSWLVSTLVVRGNRAGGYSEHLLLSLLFKSALFVFSAAMPPSPQTLTPGPGGTPPRSASAWSP